MFTLLSVRSLLWVGLGILGVCVGYLRMRGISAYLINISVVIVIVILLLLLLLSLLLLVLFVLLLYLMSSSSSY